MSARASRSIAWLFIATVGPIANAQLQLDRFFPPAVSAGEESSIKAEGKFPQWPPQIVCDRADVHLSPEAKPGELRVRIDGGSPPGVAWIRLVDDSSASRLVPLMIEPVSVSIESEPNNMIAEATTCESPSVVCGRLEKSGDLDTYRIAVKDGQTLVVSLIANRILRSPMDAVLQLVDGQGHVLMQTDDDRGLDPQLVFPVTSDGELYIRVFAFPETPNSTIGYAGDASYVYVLRATTAGMLDHVLPLVSGDEEAETHPEGWNLPDKADLQRSPATEISPATFYLPDSLGWQWQRLLPNHSDSFIESDDDGNVLRAEQLPFVFSGHILEPGEVDRMRFGLSAGSSIRVAVESKRYGFLVDSVVRLVNLEDGGVLAENDDRGRSDYDAALEYKAKQDLEAELQISDLVDGFGIGHAYSVVVERNEPAVELEASADHFLLKSVAETEIAVKISRLRGYDQRLEVSAVRLPTGVTAQPVISEAKGDSAKSVNLKLVATAEASYQGVFEIEARAIDSEGKPTGDRTTLTYPLREQVQLSDLWLTVMKEPAKETASETK